MAGDEAQAGVVEAAAERRGQPAGHVAVRGPVEPVAADAVPLVQDVGQAVEVRAGGHGLVEGGVEHGHLGDTVAEQLAGRPVALHVGRVVQGGEVEALLDPLAPRRRR